MALIATLSTHLFAYHPLDRAMIGAVASRGFGAIEIFAVPQHLGLLDLDAALHRLQSVLEAGIAIRALHAPFYASLEGLRAGKIFALGDRSPSSRRQARAALSHLLALAGEVGSPDIVLHLGHRAAECDGDQVFLSETAELLRQTPTFEGHLLVENTPQVLSAADDLTRISAQLDRRRIDLCLDLGHIFLHLSRQAATAPATEIPQCVASPEALPDAVLERIRHLHVHDNGGERDDHLPPGEGGIAWLPLLARLEALPREIGFSLELRDPESGVEPPDVVLAKILRRINGPVRDLLRSKGVRL